MSCRVSNSEKEWRGCTRCLLSESRRRVTLRDWGRVRNGALDRRGRSLYWNREPSEYPEPGLILLERGPFILFLGEAPGEQEDVTGVPFCGPAGRIFNLCLSRCTTSFHFEVTNVVACRPMKWGKSELSVVNRTPTQKEIDSCLPRIQQLTSEVKYDGIVYLGKIALNYPTSLPSVQLPHPSSILRMEYKWHDIKQFALKLDRYVSSLTKPRKPS